MWDKLEIESERVKRFIWLFLCYLLVAHIVAIFLVLTRLQTLIPLLAIASAFITIAQAGRLKIWLATVGAGVIFGLLPIAQTAGSAKDFSLWAWKAIMHTALGTSLALLLIAEIPFNGDASLALELDTAMMLFALLALTYIEREVTWYPTLVRGLAGIIIAIILVSVTLGIAYPEASKIDRWWKFLGFIKENKFTLLAIVGISVLLWKWVKIPTIPKWIPILLVLAALGSFMFSGVRNAALDTWRQVSSSPAVKGTETTRSIRVATLESFDICGLQQDTSYVFVKATTTANDRVSFQTRSKKSGKIETHKITGMFSATPEDLPYPDASYAYGALINNLPPGRLVTADERGCVKGRLNTNLSKYRSVDPFNMGYYFEK